MEIANESSGVGIERLIIHAEAGRLMEPVTLFGPKSRPHHHPRQWITFRQILVDVLSYRLVIRVPGQRPERFPSHSKKLILRAQYWIPILIPRPQKLAIDLSGCSQED